MRYPLLLCILITLITLAIPLHAQMQRAQTPPRGMQGMGADRCQKDMQQMKQSNSQVRQHLQAARESNDPAQMRAALLEAENAFAAIDKHMNGCMGMMNTMHKNDQTPHPGSSGYFHE